MYVKNIVKVYPTRLKILEYRAGYHKKDPDQSPSDEWADEYQYHQWLVNKAFAPVEAEIEFQSPPFQQVPMPHSRLYKLFLQSQDGRMGIKSNNELKALIHREELVRKSLKRTKSNIFDYIACNDFDMFITFSFGQDHYDIKKSQTKMKTWLDNQQKIHIKKGFKKFSYILIPEYHKDRKAIHFHGLFKNYQGNIVPSRNLKTGRMVVQKGKRVYNVKSYTHGFTNLTYIVNKEATGRYVSKYVTKDMLELHGQRRYWASKDLKKPEKLYNENIDDLEKELLYEGDYYTISHATLSERNTT